MAYSIDGVLDEWTAADRLDRPGTNFNGYQLYGRTEGDAFVFALVAPVAIGAGTTFWLNTDQDTTTGFQIFGNTGGAEFNINFFTDDLPYLYTGADGQNFLGGPLQHAYSADKQIVEFVVPFSQLIDPETQLSLETDGLASVLVDVNNSVFLPGNYAAGSYHISPPATLPQDTDLKVGIVYSETSANAFFDKTAYSQLFMSAQNQAAMAGIPFDILTEADLTNLEKLIGYDALIFPSMENVRAADVAAIEATLDAAVYKYGVGLVTAGNFLTNDETGAPLGGDPYIRMKTLLGVTLEGFASNATVQVVAGNTDHQVMQGYADGEIIRTYSGIGTLYFQDLTGNGEVLATQTINGQAQNAVLATVTGGRNVHFATAGMLADNNMLEDALGWAARDPEQPILSLHMSRQSVIFAARNDLDEAMQLDEVDPPDDEPGIYDLLLPILEQWKAAHNFVGSFYIDIGDGTDGTGTDWSVSKPYYDRLLALGNEIGSHSVTHPDDTNLLTAEQLQFEFEQSKQIIEQNLGITVHGAAIPGNPEKLPVSQEVLKYYSYLSGGNTQVGAGYPSAFGFLTPNDTKVYLAPNISSDFSLVGFRQMTPDQAAAAWLQEWQEMTAHADLPVILFPWHDYGITGFEPGYNQEMFTSFIEFAYQAGSEFVTLADLAGRIASFEKASFSYELVDTDTIDITVGGSGLGTFAVDLKGEQTIRSVRGWYAYDADSIFLPEGGGTFTIDLGPIPDDVTHITMLPSRAKLLTTVSTGNGGLDFSIIGEGRVVIDLEDPAGRNVVVSGAEIISQSGDRLELNLAGIGQHDVSIRLETSPPGGIVLGSGPDTLVLRVSQDAWLGDVQYTISVDGVQIGGVLTASALHSLGQFDLVTVRGDWEPGTHTVSINFLNDLYGGSPQADRNLYLDGVIYNDVEVPGSILAFGKSGAKEVSFLDGEASPPGDIVLGSGPDTLVLRVSQDAWLGDAQYTISVDGVQIGGVLTASALHSLGQFDLVTVRGDWEPGTHTVSINFLNDLYGGSPQADRNLYLDGVIYNDAEVPGSILAFGKSGAKEVSFLDGEASPPGDIVLGSGPDTLVLRVSQDAWLGDAQYTISVDGVQIGGVLTASALHSLGQSDLVTVRGDWEPGIHTVSINFLNDLYGGSPQADRNLYLDGVIYNDAEVPGSILAFGKSGAKIFAFEDVVIA